MDDKKIGGAVICSSVPAKPHARPKRAGSALRAGAVICLITVAASTAHAQGSAPSLPEARRLVDAGEAKQAATLLERDVARYAGDADFDYLLGLALYRSGRPGQAMFAFERVLMVAPGNVDARLKVAQISTERGDAKYASEVLTPLAGQRLSAEQQRQLDQLRADRAAAASRLQVRGYMLGAV